MGLSEFFKEEERKKKCLLSMDVSETVLKATMAELNLNDIGARRFLDANKNAWKIAERTRRMCNAKIGALFEEEGENKKIAEKIVDIVRRSVTGRYSNIDYKNNYFREIFDCCMIVAKWKDNHPKKDD